MAEPEIDTDKLDDAALAILSMKLHDGNRVWSGIDWSITDRLNAKGLIHDPIGKAKSLALTEDGLARTVRSDATLHADRSAEVAQRSECDFESRTSRGEQRERDRRIREEGRESRTREGSGRRKPRSRGTATAYPGGIVRTRPDCPVKPLQNMERQRPGKEEDRPAAGLCRAGSLLPESRTSTPENRLAVQGLGRNFWSRK